MSRATPALASAAPNLVAALCLVLAGCAGMAAGADEPSAEPAPQVTSRPVAPDATPAPTPEPTAAATKAPLTLDEIVGSDGRLTVLLLGSDIREGIIGERTDAIIVATVDPTSGTVAMVSLPRDTVNVPIAPGEAYPGRINTLYFELQRSTGKKKVALTKMREALAYAFDTEIDYYALVDFAGLVKLVDSIDGITLELEEAFVDPTMHLGKRGLRLKAGTRHLDGKKALAYSRSRHTDTDYDRSRRQQQVIAAAADKVRERGPEMLPALVELVRKKTITDIPMRAAPALLELAGLANLSGPRSLVLEPARWARELPGTYTISPRVIEIQKLFDRLFTDADE